MRQLFAKIQQLLREWRKRRRFASVIAPQSIRSAAEEVAHLAELACQYTPMPPSEAQRLHTLRHEMRQLMLLTEKEDFCRLSADRRIALHGSLLRSQEKLLASMQTTHAPTERMQ